MINDAAAERAVLAAVVKFGTPIFLEISTLIDEKSFYNTLNSVIYKCAANILNKNELSSLDENSILSSAQEVGVFNILSKNESRTLLKSIMETPVSRDGVKRFAVKLRKLKLINDLTKKLDDSKINLSTFSGSESFAEILGVAEHLVVDFVANLDDDDTKPTPFGHGLESIILDRCKNPLAQIGFPIMWPIFEKAIGGFRPGVHVIGARTKMGKSTLCANIGMNLAFQDIPVLYLDTEMSKLEQTDRILASMTEVETNKITTGQIEYSSYEKTQVLEAVKKLNKYKGYQHKNVVGLTFENQLALIRRWLQNDVGILSDGTAKNCAIVYDYLKLVDDGALKGDIKEYQVLGFMMTQLHSIAVKYQIPILLAVQLNRDGIDKFSTAAVSGSDRIAWLCTSFSILTEKSSEEIRMDGPNAGNRKLLPIISRFGSGLNDKEYINCHFKGWCSKITEGYTNLEIANKSTSDIGFELDDENINFGDA